MGPTFQSVISGSPEAVDRLESLSHILFQRPASPGWSCYSQLNVFAAEMPWTEFAHRLGFRLPGYSQGILYVPVWLLVVATGFPTAILWRRKRRPKAGFCKTCKYDLTGNISGTCPECGTAVEDASKHTARRRSRRGHPSRTPRNCFDD